MSLKIILRSAAVGLGGLAVVTASLLPASAAANPATQAKAPVLASSSATKANPSVPAARAGSSVRTVSAKGPGGKFTCRVDGTIWSVSGTCWVTDTAKDGKGVYLQMKGDRPFTRDTFWYRVTQNVAPGYPYTNTFRGTFVRVPVPVDRWEVRLCKDIRHTQDQCGTAKYIYR